MMHRQGLTVGKFAPFHRGHQFLVETALAECERLTVVVYAASSTTDLPLSVRASWIRALYPRAEVLEAPDAPESSGSSPEIRRTHEEFLASLAAGRGVDVFYSSEPYGAWASRVLGCLDRRVDPGRRAVPVSGTLIRSDPWEYRRFLEPLVRADLMTRVVVAGVDGGFELARTLAARLGEPCFDGGSLDADAAGLVRAETEAALGSQRYLLVQEGLAGRWAQRRSLGEAVLPGDFEAAVEAYLALPRLYLIGASGAESDFLAAQLSRRGLPYARLPAGSEGRASQSLDFIASARRGAGVQRR